MKKLSLVADLLLSALFLLSGCGGEESNAIATADTEPVNVDTIDVDLTALSSTMVYGEVDNMLLVPEDYVGQVIKLRGTYSVNFYEPTGQYYHFVIISDAAACCAQGLEFFWVGEHAYPEDYPADDAEIEVTGVFERYEDDGGIYYRIRTNEVTILGA